MHTRCTWSLLPKVSPGKQPFDPKHLIPYKIETVFGYRGNGTCIPHNSFIISSRRSIFEIGSYKFQLTNDDMSLLLLLLLELLWESPRVSLLLLLLLLLSLLLLVRIASRFQDSK